MAKWLKQSTAASIMVGPFLSASNGITSKESFTSGSVVVYKNGASGGGAINPTIAHIASGFYKLDLVSGSVDTLGRLKFTFSNSASHLPVWEDFMVMPANTYDTLVSATDRLDSELAASGIGASTISACAFYVDAIADGLANRIADHIVRRAYTDARQSSYGSASSFRSLLGAMAFLINKVDTSGSALEIFHEDDATLAGTKSITSSSTASPITTLDTD